MKLRMCVVVSLLVTLISTLQLRAGGCESWLAGPLFHQTEGIPTGSAVHTSTVWDPPNAPPLLIVGGEFQTAGGVTVNGLAGWDGASWRALDVGLDISVSAVTVFNGDLIVGGFFDEVGGVPANNIARFDGTNWHALGSGLTDVVPPAFAHCSALTVFNGELIAGGHFNNAGGQPATNIARWNGSTWTAMGAGVGEPSDVIVGVFDLRVHNGVLFIGGFFDTAGGVPVNNIAQFVNGSYFPMTSGTGGSTPGVNALRSSSNDLIVGGHFTTAGGLSATRVARWTPSGGPGSTSGAWSIMGSGIAGLSGDGVHAFSIHPLNGQLVAGGSFTGCVSIWNGSSWSTLAGGVSGGITNDPRVFALEVFNSKLVAAGQFGVAGNPGTVVTNIAQFDGSFWSSLQPPYPQVAALETLGSRIIAGGTFIHSTTDLAPANNLVAWNGATLSPITNGANDSVLALKSYTTGSGIFTTRHLVVGGNFTAAGGLFANRIALWSEPTLTIPSWSTLGAGFNNSVSAIERFNNFTHAAGDFTHSGATLVNHIARFDGTNWVALGSGMNGTVHALKTYNGFLYAGGDFTTAGGVSSGGLARWNGSAWTNVGGFFLGSVYALEVHNNELVIGGNFVGLPGSPNIAKYNGTSYSTLGTGGTDNPVTDLKSNGQFVYVSGGFGLAGGDFANHVARWSAADGWSEVAGGSDEVVQALAVYNNEIHAGLGIALGIAGGGTPEPGLGWVRYTQTGAPWIASHPFFQTVDCGQDVTFSITPADGYSNLTFAWRKDGIALSNGPTGDGSTISGADTAELIIGNVLSADQGAYDCVLSNPCGSITSFAATLTVNGECQPCLADVSGDQLVDVNDLLAVINAWGATGPNPADVNGDQIVDVNDLLEVISAWGACP